MSLYCHLHSKRKVLGYFCVTEFLLSGFFWTRINDVGDILQPITKTMCAVKIWGTDFLNMYTFLEYDVNKMLTQVRETREYSINTRLKHFTGERVHR